MSKRVNGRHKSLRVRLGMHVALEGGTWQLLYGVARRLPPPCFQERANDVKVGSPKKAIAMLYIVFCVACVAVLRELNAVVAEPYMVSVVFCPP